MISVLLTEQNYQPLDRSVLPAAAVCLRIQRRDAVAHGCGTSVGTAGRQRDARGAKSEWRVDRQMASVNCSKIRRFR